MLYENENISIYDPVTGEETPQSLDARADQELDAVIAEANKLETLQKSRGWKVVTAWLNDTIAQYKELLVYEQDAQKVVRLQEAVKCYANIQNFVSFKVHEGQEFLERKRTLSNEVNPKE